MIRDEQVHETASMYYPQGRTTETIARRLGASHSSVPRLLPRVRKAGLIRTSASTAPGNKGTLSGQVSEVFGVWTFVAPVHDIHIGVSHLYSVSFVATERLIDVLKPGVALGVAWGGTASEITRYMPRVNFPGSTVAQLNGATITTGPGMLYADAIIFRAARVISGCVVHPPVPTFFDYAEIKDALWCERSVQAVLKTIEDCDIVFFGISPLFARLPSHIYSGGFLDTERPVIAQHDGVVGDVCIVLLREDGSTDMVLNSRTSGLTPETPRRISCCLCVVVGASRTLLLLGALRVEVITDLVPDDGAARGLLELARSCTVRAKGTGR